MKTALALYTVYDELHRDLNSTLHGIYEAGYDGVEFYGPRSWPAGTVRSLLRETSLELCGWQTEWALLQPEQLEDTLRYMEELGCREIIVPCLGGPWNIGHTQEENSAEIWKRHAEELNRLNARLRREGFLLGYHTHAHEFSDRFGTVTPWDILCTETGQDIFLELDTGSCIESGCDPAAALKQASGKLFVVHCKPFGAKRLLDTPLGAPDDQNDWMETVRLCMDGGCKWLAIENEAENRGNKLKTALEDLRALEKYL